MSQKVAPSLKLFAIFSLRLSIFPWNFADLLTVYIRVNVSRSAYHFTVSCFEFQQVRLP